MAELITELRDADIRTEWLHTSPQASESDPDGTDGGDTDGADGSDSDGTDGADTDGTDGRDADGTDG